MTSISWDDGRVVLVDMRKPAEPPRLIEADDVERVALAIRGGEVRGASATAAAAAYGLALAAVRSPAVCAEGLMADLEAARQLLAVARPGAAGLVSALDRMMAFARGRIAAGTDGFPEAMLAEAGRIAGRDPEVGGGSPNNGPMPAR